MEKVGIMIEPLTPQHTTRFMFSLFDSAQSRNTKSIPFKRKLIKRILHLTYTNFQKWFGSKEAPENFEDEASVNYRKPITSQERSIFRAPQPHSLAVAERRRHQQAIARDDTCLPFSTASCQRSLGEGETVGASRLQDQHVTSTLHER